MTVVGEQKHDRRKIFIRRYTQSNKPNLGHQTQTGRCNGGQITTKSSPLRRALLCRRTLIPNRPAFSISASIFATSFLSRSRHTIASFWIIIGAKKQQRLHYHFLLPSIVRPTVAGCGGGKPRTAGRCGNDQPVARAHSRDRKAGLVARDL